LSMRLPATNTGASCTPFVNIWISYHMFTCLSLLLSRACIVRREALSLCSLQIQNQLALLNALRALKREAYDGDGLAETIIQELLEASAGGRFGCKNQCGIPVYPKLFQQAAMRAFKTKIRRLYDIVNVFLSMGLLAKVEERAPYPWKHIVRGSRGATGSDVLRPQTSRRLPPVLQSWQASWESFPGKRI
jgi:hypothetical protein